ncbi:MAG: bifunctional methylenetetrahydrofolate dehydrogenase/methenyltetrahydrofolate cyclohydrolase FolD [Solirubrobacteraceae bacterium]
MAAKIIDGRAAAARVRAKLAGEVAALTESLGRPPGLATILVGEDPASELYVGLKRKACVEAGIADQHRHLRLDASERDVVEVIEACNRDPEVNGILLQLPVPPDLDGSALTALIAPEKDVDGLTPISAGRLAQGISGLRPCTPLGILELLDEYGVELEGAQVVVVGRSNLLGKPLAALLLARNATVTIGHSRTRELAGVCARADVLVAAAGVPALVGAEHVKPGAAVIDAGTNRTEEGLRGDVQFAAVSERAGLITPVPGGVGPMTIAMLLRNTLLAATAAAAATTAAGRSPES